MLPQRCHHPWSPTTLHKAQFKRLSFKDFSNPQGGKGPCDRKAAVIKSHMRLHLDSGHDISNAEEMKLAIESCGGVRGVATVAVSYTHLTLPTNREV